MTKFSRTPKQQRAVRPTAARRAQHSLPGMHVMLIGLLIGTGIFYLLQMNALATKGYQIKDLENSVAELNQQNSDLQLQALSLQSSAEVANRVKDLGMVNAGQPSYMQDHAVAVAR